MVLLAAALVALVWANSPVAGTYERFWQTEIGLEVGSLRLAEPLRLWINDLAMALFFFVVGLEVKRELTLGALSDPRAAALPIACALGGMVVPALLYLALNGGSEGARGWGIPIATDIAFALGVLALLGRRAPFGLRAFLLTLAVADDIGAILVIAVFYSADVALGWLLLALAVVVAVVTMERAHVRAFAPYVAGAAVLWFALFESGVHATLAGVVLGLLTPQRPFHPPETVVEEATYHLGELRADPPDGVADEREQSTLLFVSELATEAVSPLARLEDALHPWSSYLVLPLFALANAGVDLSGLGPGALLEPVTLGVLLGLVVGKPVGVVAAAALALATRRVRLPEDVGWREVAGAGLLAGIGFTVSIFVAGLAFPSGSAGEGQAKVGILLASVLAGAAGAAVLALSPRRPRRAPRAPASAPPAAGRTAG